MEKKKINTCLKKKTQVEKKSGYICFLRMESKLKKTQAYLDLAASTQCLSSSVHKRGLLARYVLSVTHEKVSWQD